MQQVSLLILGLGLFFLGMQLVGENLRRLSSGSFRSVISSMGDHPLAGSAAGIVFGALMQSATAVTFILCGMCKSGLVSQRAASPIIIWSNVGLTALAFAATLDIHPFVAVGVGLAGIFFGMTRRSFWRAIAGVFLGVGLVLFGLESMGAGASVFHGAPWFDHLLQGAAGHPFLAFGIGILAAALLQSNTGAAMLVITLAGTGTIRLEQAALLIYGTNLGAIGLRIFLSVNLDPLSLRLVRLEDAFCIWSGIVMMSLFYLEQMGVPLVFAGAELASSSVPFQAALLFLLSNLLPALLFPVISSPVTRYIAKNFPSKESETRLASPRYLSPEALSDFTSSMELMDKETVRLVASLRAEPAESGEDGEPPRPKGFPELAEEIEKFSAKLVAQNPLTENQAFRLHLLRAELSVARYLSEAVGELNVALSSASKKSAGDTALLKPFEEKMNSLLQLLRQAGASLDPEEIETLRAASKNQANLLPGSTPDSDGKKRESEEELEDRFQLAAWIVHRYAKVLSRRAAPIQPKEKNHEKQL